MAERGMDVLKEMDIRSAKIEDLTDIRDVKVDRSQSLEKRRQSYLEAVGNPYMVRVGNIKVGIRFADKGVSFEEAFENMLRSV